MNWKKLGEATAIVVTAGAFLFGITWLIEHHTAIGGAVVTALVGGAVIGAVYIAIGGLE